MREGTGLISGTIKYQHGGFMSTYDYDMTILGADAAGLTIAAGEAQ